MSHTSKTYFIESKKRKSEEKSKPLLELKLSGNSHPFKLNVIKIYLYSIKGKVLLIRYYRVYCFFDIQLERVLFVPV
jgi:hypothetical protein